MDVIYLRVIQTHTHIWLQCIIDKFSSGNTTYNYGYSVKKSDKELKLRHWQGIYNERNFC